jgi:hypothetical protein
MLLDGIHFKEMQLCFLRKWLQRHPPEANHDTADIRVHRK